MLLSPHEVIEPELPTIDDLDKWFTGYANPQLKEHARAFAMGHDIKLKLNAALFKSFWVEVQNRFNEQGWYCHLNTLTGIGSESEITIYIQPRQKQHEAPEATAWAAFQQGYKDAMMNEKPKRKTSDIFTTLGRLATIAVMIVACYGAYLQFGYAWIELPIMFYLGWFVGVKGKK